MKNYKEEDYERGVSHLESMPQADSPTGTFIATKNRIITACANRLIILQGGTDELIDVSV